MKIYFAASISGGRDHAHFYPVIVAALKRHGTVLSEHFADNNITNRGEKFDARYIHDRDMNWVLEADVIVADVTTPSTGVGYEIGRAIEHGKHILCLHQPQDGKRLSGMIEGSTGIAVQAYRNDAEITKHIDDFFAKHVSRGHK